MIDQIICSDLHEVRQELDEDAFSSRRVLVTGGAGFVGSWLCDILVSAKAIVHCVDNLSTGVIENIDHLPDVENFSFEEMDVTQLGLHDEKYDMIFHLASRASPEEYQQHPIETLLANSLGTWNILELARKSDAILLYTSSSEAYGNPQVVPTPETYWGMVNPIGARSCYDEGKRFSEALCMAYQRSCGLDVLIARIFNTFGPRIRQDGAYGRAVARFIGQALRGHDITVYGDGKQTRSFCYITDTLIGLLKMIVSNRAKGEVLNIGNSHEIRILDLAQLIDQLAGSRSKIIFGPLPCDDPPRRCPDISKARQMLGWEPKVCLEDALKRTIEWFRLKQG